MKKSTLLTFLFAILMIALLVSCADPADPLPSGGGETTTDAAGGEVTTDEVTTDEVTTAEPSGSGDDAVTTDAAVTTEAITLPEIEEPVEVADTETPWYITGWTEDPKWREGMLGEPGEIPVPEELQGYAFQVPLTYEAKAEGIALRAEFFQEFYRVGELMQVRFTLRNETDEDYTFHSNAFMLMRIFGMDNSGAVTNRISANLYAMPSEGDPDYYTWEYYAQEDIKYLTVPKGESLTLEYAFYISPEQFDPESKYELIFRLGVADPLDFGKYPARMVKIALKQP